MNKFFAKLAGLILLFCSCVVGADILWKLFPSASATATVPRNLTQSSAQAITRSSTTQAWNINTLKKANLFGKAPAKTIVPARAQNKPVKPAVRANNKPITRLNLILTGLMYSDDASKASAVITNQRRQDVYQVSETIMPNVTLDEINEDHVVLMNRGRSEILRLTKADALAKQTVRTVTRSTSNLRDADNQALSAGKRMKILRDHIRDNPQKIHAVAQKYLRVRPKKRNGQVVGYRVYPGRDRRLFNASGLKSGEVVKNVNGISIDNPLALAAEAESGTTFNLTVENRRGEERQVTLNLSD